MAKQEIKREGWQQIIAEAAKKKSKDQFPVAMIDGTTQQLRLQVGEQLQVKQILEYMTELSKRVDTEEGRGMLAGLHGLAGKVVNKNYSVAMCSTAFGVKKDIYGLFDDDNRPFLALGFGWVEADPPNGDLYIALLLDKVDPEQKIGYIAKPCETPEEIAEFVGSLVLGNPYQRNLKEAEDPKAVHNIVNEGHAVYYRFGEVFAPPDYRM